MRAILLALALVGVAALAPTAMADVTFGFDGNGDWDCNDPGETVRVPTPGDRIHHHAPCAV